MGKGILKILLKLDSGLSKKEINFLVEKSYLIAINYIRINYRRAVSILGREGLNEKELAIDGIAELFKPDNEGKLQFIHQAFISWKPEIQSESDAVYFLNKIVSKKIEQHLNHLLRLNDPLFSKLLDSLSYNIRQNGFGKITVLGRTYIVPNADDVEISKFISSEEFDKIPMDLIRNRKTLLVNIFDYLNNETDFSPAIPINELVKKLKEIQSIFFLIDNNVQFQSGQMEMKEILDFSLGDVKNRLFESYVKKGKINNIEREAFESALDDLGRDLCDGGIIPGLYNYLTPYFPDLKKEDYEDKYHNVLEYLLKVLKSSIAEKIG